MATLSDIQDILNTMAHMPNSPLLGAKPELVKKIMDNYYELLKDIDTSLLKAASLQYQREETYFPPVNGLIQKVRDLQMIAMGFPSPVEAWAMALRPSVRSTRYRCDIANEIIERQESAYAKNEGSLALTIQREYNTHIDQCKKCVFESKEIYVYEHPVIETVINRIGGRDIVFTDNPVADRARFIEAYRDILASEVRIANITPETMVYLQSSSLNLNASEKIKQLSEGMRK